MLKCRCYAWSVRTTPGQAHLLDIETGDWNGRQYPDNVTLVEQVAKHSTDWRPQLRAADIGFSTDAAGWRTVLGGGAFGTVSFFGFLVQ